MSVHWDVSEKVTSEFRSEPAGMREHFRNGKRLPCRGRPGLRLQRTTGNGPESHLIEIDRHTFSIKALSRCGDCCKAGLDSVFSIGEIRFPEVFGGAACTKSRETPIQLPKLPSNPSCGDRQVCLRPNWLLS